MRDAKSRGRVDSGGSTSPTAPPEVTDAVRHAVDRHRGERGPLMEILHDVQVSLGCIPPPAIPLLAFELNISPADVYGVVTFYNDFREQPAGRRTVRICRAEACQSLGSEQLVDQAITSLGVELGGTTSDGDTTLGQVFCFGNCALGPSVEVDGQLFGRVTPARLDAMLTAGRSDG